MATPGLNRYRFSLGQRKSSQNKRKPNFGLNVNNRRSGIGKDRTKLVVTQSLISSLVPCFYKRKSKRGRKNRDLSASFSHPIGLFVIAQGQAFRSGMPCLPCSTNTIATQHTIQRRTCTHGMDSMDAEVLNGLFLNHVTKYFKKDLSEVCIFAFQPLRVVKGLLPLCPSVSPALDRYRLPCSHGNVTKWTLSASNIVQYR